MIIILRNNYTLTILPTIIYFINTTRLSKTEIMLMSFLTFSRNCVL